MKKIFVVILTLTFLIVNMGCAYQNIADEEKNNLSEKSEINSPSSENSE